MLAGQGVTLNRSTLVHWVDRAAWWLEGLYDLQLRTIHGFPRIFCDETPLPVLEKGRRRTRKCQLWAHAVDDRPWQGPAPPAVVYRYAEDRRGRLCHVDDDGPNGISDARLQATAAAAVRHASNASFLNVRCVDAVVRWRRMLNVL